MRDVLKSQHHGERNNLNNGHFNNNIGFFVWLRHPYKGLPYLLISILFMLVALFVLFHYYLSNYYNFTLDGSKLSSHDGMNVGGGGIRKLERFGDGQSHSEMLLRIDELKNIKTSVNKELLLLEKKRQQLLTEIGNYSVNIENLKLAYKNEILEIDKISLKLNNLKLEYEEMKKNNQPYLEAPLKLVPRLPVNSNEGVDEDYYSNNRLEENNSKNKFKLCSMSSCFDYSRCSMFSQFPVYVYNTSESKVASGSTNDYGKLLISASNNRYVTSDPNIACLYVLFLTHSFSDDESMYEKLKSLPYWSSRQDSIGINHLVVITNLMSTIDDVQQSNQAVKRPDSFGRAVIAQSSAYLSTYRRGFDVILPPVETILSLESLYPLPMMVPVKRKYLMTFNGDASRYYSSIDDDDNYPRGMQKLEDGLDAVENVKPYHLVLDKIINTLNMMQDKFPSDSFEFKFVCQDKKSMETNRPLEEDFGLCGSQSNRISLLEQSTFSLILMADHAINKMEYSLSTIPFQIRLMESLRSGAVPVVVGVKGEIVLPFEEVIDWTGAVMWAPTARITELHFTIKSVVEADILEMRRRGRLIYETYFASTSRFVESLFSLIRVRLQIPPLPLKDTPSENYFNDTFPMLEPLPSDPPDNEEVLGPIEPSMDSLTFQRNFTSFLKLHPFENLLDTLSLFPHTPFRPLLSGDAKYLGSSYGFRPIADGLGGSGKEFTEALGGDYPREQFTIVILTYERETVLVSAVSQFKGLPHLNKVVIIWNSDKPPSNNLKWPDIGVKVEAIKMTKNSLNNRFLPFDTIKTEAVLSIDDDVHLRHDEIIFAFRVWRQARDRIVGFPGRFVSFYKDSNNFFYNSNYSCEMSMVLTGAAFLHKYYMYVYSYIMPQAIREKVDEFLNCEDIAMNFLVSHITRKPPIKVTSRWTFKCPSCPNTLYAKDSHFDERHQCISFFTKIYGYLPLLTTQYRADSILFKTRIPHDKQKCFRYI